MAVSDTCLSFFKPKQRVSLSWVSMGSGPIFFYMENIHVPQVETNMKSLVIDRNFRTWSLEWISYLTTFTDLVFWIATQAASHVFILQVGNLVAKN